RLFWTAALFRPRGKWGRELFGETALDREDWFCSELVMAACIAMGRVDPEKTPANSVYPRDLFLDVPTDFSATWEAPLLWSGRPVCGTMRSLIDAQLLEEEEQDVFQNKK